ncbi:MAG: carbon-nitrogen hydrolase family protein [Thermoanaerobaculia bacterium]
MRPTADTAMTSFRAAVIQMTSTGDESRNLEIVESLVREAAAHGADLVCTPENTNFLGSHYEKVRRAEALTGPTCNFFAGLARELEIHLLLGSFNERSNDSTRCFNTSVLFGPDGELLAKYRKIHLFDVDLSDEVRFFESATVKPGTEVVAVDTAFGCLGFSICYDLRFPELYRSLRTAGADILTVPSAFTKTTGTDHWHLLLRARAIENQCFVLAPAQIGKHGDGGLKESYGHAMIIDPWGRILDEVTAGMGIATAMIDLQYLAEVRGSMPVESHRSNSI